MRTIGLNKFKTKIMMDKQSSLKVLLLGLAFFLLSQCGEAPKPTFPDDGTTKLFDESLQPFYHGVASGDPLYDRVIIWTRLTPRHPGMVQVRWEMATDKEFKNIVAKGFSNAEPEKDYTIKVDVAGLEVDTYYYYKFISKGKSSVVGRTKTAPSNETKEVQLAVVSCTNYEFGYYNSFARIAKRENLDAVVHLGDYIYEYAPGGYGDTSLQRLHIPAKELLKLSDYRTRYGQYRLDQDFQKVHQMHPFVMIWDDHEISNDAHVSGAQNHTEDTEGDYISRREAARKAYYEWMPIRENVGGQLYRKIELGKVADLIMLDERLAGRTEPSENMADANYNDDDRSMLGQQQLEWFTKTLAGSQAKWRIIGNQVIFAPLDQRDIFPEKPRNMDAWDGYPAEKQQLISFFDENQISDIVFVTGDTHCSWAFEVPKDIASYQKDGSTVAVELATPSITSSNYDEYATMDTVQLTQGIYMQRNPHLKYVNLHQHGYLLLTANLEELKAEWFYAETVKERASGESRGAALRISEGKISELE